ncbi:MAG: outer membrane protein assembly factor BamB family protein, partial [Planctomycetota bacterium]|jgi:outer membrane protein assembly factor BamB
MRDFRGTLHAFKGESSPAPVEVWALFNLANHFITSGRPSAAVQEYQRLVENHTDVPFHLRDKRGPSGKLATEAIDELIARQGRGVYEKFDKVAKALFEKGVKARETQPLTEILVRFPNALVFGPSLLALGRIHLDLEEYDLASDVLKRYLREFDRAEKAPAALVLLFTSLEKQKRFLEARRVLLRLKRRFPFAVLEGVEGGPKTAGPWATAKLAEKTFAQVRGATLREDVAWEGGKDLWDAKYPRRPVLIPTRGTRPFEIDPFVVIRLGPEIKALAAKDGRILWSTSVDGDPKKLHYSAQTLVVEENYKLFGLHPESGKLRWTRTFSRRGIVKGVTVRGDVVAATVSDYDGKTSDIWLVVMDADSGEDVVEPKRLAPWGGLSIPEVGKEIVTIYIRQGTPRVFAFDLVDGRELMGHTVDGLLQCAPVLFEDDKRLVYGTFDHVTALDLSGRKMWSQKIGGIDRDSIIPLGSAVVVTRRDNRGRQEVVAFDIKEGKILWRTDTGMANIHHRDAVGGSLYVMGMRGGEENLLNLDSKTGAVTMSALISDRQGFPPTVNLGLKVGVAKLVWRSPRQFKMESAFRIFDLKTGKILHVLEVKEGTLSERFTVVDGRLVYANGNLVRAWGK